MSTFKERYDELFGPSAPYDPIKMSERTEDRADQIMEAAPDASPSRTPAIPLGEAPEYTPPDDSGFFENVSRLFGAGTVQVGEMGLGAAEYVARNNEFLDGIVADTLYAGRRGLGEVREGILSGISADDIRKVEGELLTLDPNRTIWTSPGDAAEAIIYKTAQALPATLVTMIPAIRWARAASPGTAIAYMGASEGTMSTGAIANGITDEIMSIPTEQLLQESPRFAELLEQHGGNADEARDQLIREAQGFAPLAGGATVAAISSVAGRYFTPIFEKSGGAALGNRVARGFAAEAPQEGAQGASEQFVQNYAARIYDLDRQLSEGVAEAAAQEGLIGGVMGGGTGGMFGQRPTPDAPPPTDAPPGQMGLPGIEPGVLPDEMDQPTPEPQGDIEAQINDLLNEDSPRAGVYIAPGTDERLVATIAETLPAGLFFTRDVDGRGGHLVTKNEELGLRAQEAIANGTSRQAVIGRIVGAGVGKPTGPNTLVVQLLDEQGMVARESMVANRDEANTTADTWAKEKGNKGRQIIVLTPEEAIERREVIGDAPAEYGVQKDLFDDQPVRPPAVIPTPEGGVQQDLPLTRGRERGRGRIPIPPQQIEEQQSFPEDEEAGLDPFEVSRRQDDMFEGEATFEPSVQDEVRDDIRSTVPFEEREGAFRAVEGARSVQQAADTLTGEAAAEFAEEQRDRIGGFYNPDRLTFDNPEYEAAYRAAWAKKDTKEMGRIRQVAKPKLIPGKSESLIKAAQKVSPATRKELREKARAENEPEPGPRQPGTATAQRNVDRDYLGEFTPMTREEIDKLEGRDLDEAFERAALFREGREADSKVEDDVVRANVKEDEGPAELTGELTFQEEEKDEGPGQQEVKTSRVDRGKYRTPGQKKKFIRREAEHARRRETGQRSVKATPVRRSTRAVTVKRRPGESESSFNKRVSKAETRRKFDTAPLTQENYKLDESAEDRETRVARAKEARAELGKSATKANAHLRKLKGKTRTQDMTDKQRKDFLYARNYLQQLIQFARSVQRAKSESTQTIKLAEGIKAMLDVVPELTDQQFATQWGRVAKQNEFDDLANLKFTDLAAMRDPKARAKATRETNKDVAGRTRLRALNEHLKDDQLYQRMIKPVLHKMSEYVMDIADGRTVTPYLPTELEMAELRYAMQTLKNNWSPARLSDMGENMQREFAEFMVDKKLEVYQPIREQMERVGFQFDENGNLSGFDATEEYLGPRYRERFKGQQELSAWDIQRGAIQTIENLQPSSAAPVVTPTEPTGTQPRVVRGEQTVEEAMAALEGRKKFIAGKVKTEPGIDYEVEPGLLQIDAINELMGRLKKATSTAKTTISGIKRAEARFIRGLKKIGAWRQTSADMGQIIVPGRSKNYRMVGPRLDAKTLRKPEAREILQRLKPMPIPRNLMPDVKAARQDDALRAGLERFLDEDALDLYNDAAKPTQYDAEYTGVAERLGEMMVEGKITGQDVVNTIMEIAPQNSFYRNLAERLSRKDTASVEVTFGVEKDFPRGQLGKFLRSKNRIILNRDALNMSNLRADEVYGARVVHTLTHELVHAQTHAAIDTNPRLRQYFEALQKRAREVWNARIGDDLPYGLKVLAKSQNQAHEFVTEAFTNHEFQQFLKDTPLQPDTGFNLWQALVKAVRYILDLPQQAPNNLFDAIMLTEDILFDDAGLGGSTEGELFLTGEGVIDNISTHVQDALGSGIWGKFKDKARNLMTFEQLHERYSKFFTDGSFNDYMEAWGLRNAAVSKNMKEGEDLSVRWTEMEQTSPEEAVAISEIGTDATLYKMTPAEALSAADRAKLSKKRLARYDELRNRFTKLSPKAQQLYKDISSYYKGASQKEADLMLSASLRGILTKGPGKKLTTEQFKARFTRAKIAEMKDKESIKDELADLIPEEEIDDLVTELQRMASLRTIGYGDYFPLMRYGDYVVYAESARPDQIFDDIREARAERARLLEDDPSLDIGVVESNGKAVLKVTEKEFWMFENKSEATNKRAELDEVYDRVTPVQARLSRETQDTAISSNAALNTILTTLKGNPAAQAAVKQHYLRSLSDQSFRKHELKRKNRRGVDATIQHRNLANYMKQSAYYRAQLEHGWQMGEALQQMATFSRARADTDEMSTEQLQRVVEQVRYRDAMTNDNVELKDFVRGAVSLTQFMMLTSPSYWAVNASQPWLVSFPVIGGRFGYASTWGAFKDAQSLVSSSVLGQAKGSWGGVKALLGDAVATEAAFNVVDDVIDSIKKSGHVRANELIDMIDYLRDRNIVDINVLTELRQIAEGSRADWRTKALDASRILAHITEVNNRAVTAVAAYNLARNDGQSIEEAQKYAQQMVSQTQFNYSSENKPPLFQPGGPLKWAAPLMFQFMQWPQHMYALLIRNYRGAFVSPDLSAEEKAAHRKALLGLLGTHAAVGGAVGMMLQPIKWALGMFMFAFGDDDEPYTFANAINGRTFDNMISETLTELFGDTAGRALSHGLPTLAGFDVSARMSMGTLYFVDLRGDTAEGVMGSLVASFGGATLNQAMNWGNALNKMRNGEVLRGVEQASPKILRDFLRSVRYYNDGLVNNQGDTVIPASDLSFAEVFLQGIGFSPDEVSQFYSSQTAIKGAQGYARDRRDRLVRKFVDDGMNNETMKEVMEFNRAYPSLRITRSTLIRAARSRLERESRYRRYGANIDEKQAIDFAEYGEPYR